MNFIRPDEVEAIRNRIDHPIIDSDGHHVEYLPLVRDFIAEDAGEDVARKFDQMFRTAATALRDASWRCGTSGRTCGRRPRRRLRR